MSKVQYMHQTGLEQLSPRGMEEAEFRVVRGIDNQKSQPPDLACLSNLESTGENTTKQRTMMPMDMSCCNRLEAITNKKRWTAFLAKADRAIRVPEEVWKSLFRCPLMHQEAKQKL